jgi:peptide deformylase
MEAVRGWLLAQRWSIRLRDQYMPGWGFEFESNPNTIVVSRRSGCVSAPTANCQRFLSMIRPVLKMGDPLLLQVAHPVQRFDTPELATLLGDMHDTMEALNGAGLAAPQIGVSQQVVVFGVARNPRYPQAEEVPYTVLINPQVEPLTPEMEEGWEGCLSVPGMRGLVPRYTRLRYRGVDQFGKPIDRTVSGFHARVVQHEVDHLNGILYPMRIRDLRNFGFNETLFPGQDLRDE